MHVKQMVNSIVAKRHFNRFNMKTNKPKKTGGIKALYKKPRDYQLLSIIGQQWMFFKSRLVMRMWREVEQPLQ